MKLAKNKATVFNPVKDENRKNTVRATIGTYEGEDQNGEARYSNWSARFVNKAFEKALGLNDKASISITDSKIERFYDKEKDTAYVNVIIFDFDIEE